MVYLALYILQIEYLHHQPNFSFKITLIGAKSQELLVLSFANYSNYGFNFLHGGHHLKINYFKYSAQKSTKTGFELFIT